MALNSLSSITNAITKVGTAISDAVSKKEETKSKSSSVSNDDEDDYQAQELEEYDEKIEEAQEKIEELKEKLDELQKKLQRNQALKAMYESDYKNLEGRLSDLSQKLQSAEDNRVAAGIEKNIATLTGQMKDLAADIEVLDNKIASIQEKYDDTNEDYKSTTKEYTDLQKERYEAQSEYDKKQSEALSKSANSNTSFDLSNMFNVSGANTFMNTVSSGVSAAANAIVNTACQYMGKTGKDFPGFTPNLWCADFVTKIITDTLGTSTAIGTGSSSVSGLMQKAGNNFIKTSGQSNKSLIITQNIKPGDVVIFKNGRSHTGLVKSVNPDGSFTTVEGNSGNKVVSRTYSADEATLTGFIKIT